MSLNIEEGEIVLIMGPSGSGKTTLITMAGALLKPTSGEVIINGGRVSDLKEKDLARVRLNKLGFVFQSFNLLSSLGALENVAVPLIAAGVRRKAALAQARIGL